MLPLLKKNQLVQKFKNVRSKALTSEIWKNWCINKNLGKKLFKLLSDVFKEIRLVCPVCFVHASESPQDMYVSHLMTCELCMNTVWKSNLQSVVLRLAGKFRLWETWWGRAVWRQGGATYLCCTLQQQLPTFFNSSPLSVCSKSKTDFHKKSKY